MASFAAKVAKVPGKLWEHKKKTAFGCFLLYLGGNYLAKAHKNSKIRAEYAKLAVKYGDQTISAEERPRRVTILANVSANERSCYDDFSKNVLPLFHLAGLQVDIIKSDSETQLEALAGAVDHEEADALYIVGGDGTLGRVVTGIFRNRAQAVLPMGVFPGGYDNLTLTRLVPAVFGHSEDVRRYCESAMALIEGAARPVNAFQYQKEGPEEKPFYGVGDVGAGWFRHIEDRRKKLWYFAGLKRRWAYIWEMLKRFPEQLELALQYEEFCAGCQTCRPVIVPEKPQWRWWHILTGTPKAQLPVQEKDYSGIVNENCGRLHEATIAGTDLIVENEQDQEGSHIRLRLGGSDFGRFGVISEGMKRCSAGTVGVSQAPQFYSTDLVANSLRLQFNRIPEFLSKIYFSSDAGELKDGESVTISKTSRPLQLYLPSSLRVDANSF